MTSIRFEEIASCDVDLATVRVGLEHGDFGPPDPVITINTGALVLEVRPHHADLPSLVEMLQALCDRFPQQPFEREIQWTATKS